MKDFFKVTGSRLEAFYQEHAHLRGEDLRSKVEEVVLDWKTQTTRIEFNQDAEYMDEVDVREKYKNKPEVAENIILNGKRFFCPVKKLTMYADPKYTAKVQDAVEHGTTEKRKGQMALKEDEMEQPSKKAKAKAKAKGKGAEESTGGNEEPKMKANEKKKLSKKLEALVTKAALLKDSLDKANQFGEMIPKYVLEAGQKELADLEQTTTKTNEILASGKGESQPVIDDMDKRIEACHEATQRIKAQLDSAAAFKWALFD